jgi:probable HAF family extracellular repeat protein
MNTNNRGQRPGTDRQPDAANLKGSHSLAVLALIRPPQDRRYLSFAPGAGSKKGGDMKSRTLTCVIAMTLFAALSIPTGVAVQGQPQNKQQPRYKLVDLGTFGGPTSAVPILEQVVNGRGALVGQADTPTPDPFAPNCFNDDCYVSHAFQWQSGVQTDLGTLPGGDSSTAGWINANGLIIGQAQNGQIDPLTGGPELRAVVWKGGSILDLGTFGGDESASIGENDRGQVIGVALNAITDPFSFFGATQARAFMWEGGTMRDLGTLGGPDAFGQYVNSRGQVVGFSYTSYTPNQSTGVPTIDPFLWERGKMLDLGTLGGTFGQVNDLNDPGEVVGTSNLAGDVYTHGFIWSAGVLSDVGTFGGDNGEADWINNAGEVAGSADFPGDQVHHGFLWKDGALTDLGTVNGDPCSRAYGINSSGQIVGASTDCFSFLHAFLWQNGGPSIDLNTLIPPSSSLQLVAGFFISDRGEIAGLGVPSGCSPQDVYACGHAFLLIPCGKDDERCGDTAEGETATSQSVRELVPPRRSTATGTDRALSGRSALDRLRTPRFPGKPAQELDKLIHPKMLTAPLAPLASGNRPSAGQAAATTGCIRGSGELSPGTTRDIGSGHYCQVTKSGSRYLLTGYCLTERTCTLVYAGISCPEGDSVPSATYIAACKTWDEHRGLGCN